MTARSFLTTHAPDNGLFQSTEWATLQAASGHEAHTVSGTGFEARAFLQALPLIGGYLFIPRGPIVDTALFDSESLKMKLIEVALSAKAGWLRVEPQTESVLRVLRRAFGETHVVPAPRDMSPREIFRVSLEGEPSAWLERMKSKTRYNVRLSEKHGVTVRFSRALEDLEAFIDLIYATTNRKAIAPHPKAYYRNFIATIPEDMCTLALAEYEGQTIAASLLVFFEGTAYYLHGGSADTKRERMAPFLLHLKSMEEAKRRGCSTYDFGGVRLQSKDGASDTDWEGITRFKQGFDPKAETLVFPGTYDIIVSPFRYVLYRQLHWLVGIRRSFRNMIK